MAESDEGEDKTEDATPKKRSDARERGQTALSQEAVGTASLAAAGVATVLGGGAFATAMGASIAGAIDALPTLSRDALDPAGAARLMFACAEPVAGPALAVCVAALAIALLSSFAQVGFLIAPKAIELDVARISPTKGFGRLFNARSIVRTGAALLKIGLTLAAAAWTSWSYLDELSALGGLELGPALAALGFVLLRTTGAALGVLIAIAVADVLYQRWQHERDLRMSKKEVREEARQSEGDPHVRGRIRAMQREIGKRRMMAEVPKATVVITNPTHYAVALRYDAADGADAAPRVVAKGVDDVAQKIKAVAREHGVPLYEDVPLARALHASSEIGDRIPERLFQAVAGVLAWVYRTKPAAREGAAR